MAGIGWRLERLIDRGTLASTAAAYVTGASVMALPWLLTTAVLAIVPAVAGAGGVVQVAYAVALLVAAPVQVVSSRLCADHVYEGRLSSIAAPLRRALALVIALCAAGTAGFLAMRGASLGTAWCGGALAAAVGAQWTALSVGNGLCSAVRVVGAVVAGAVASLVFAWAGSRVGSLGYLIGMALGACVALGVLLAGIGHALPDHHDEHAPLWPAFHHYADLAAAGLAYNAALWVDKLAVEVAGTRAEAATHTTCSILAWAAAVPCLAWVFVESETIYHRRVWELHADLERGATLAILERGVDALAAEVARIVRGVIVIQLGSILFVGLAAPRITTALGLPSHAVASLRLLLVATSAQTVTLTALIMLYYLDRRREALRVALVALVAVAAGTVLATRLLHTPAAGTVCGSAVSAAYGAWFAHRGARAALEHALLR